MDILNGLFSLKCYQMGNPYTSPRLISVYVEQSSLLHVGRRGTIGELVEIHLSDVKCCN